jgi:hypothetical protein
MSPITLIGDRIPGGILVALAISEILRPGSGEVHGCDPVGSLSVIVKVPARMPVAAGVKVIEIVQEAPVESVAPHLLVWLKSPFAVIFWMVRSWPLLALVRVTFMGALVVPTGWLEKFRVSGETFAIGGKHGTNPPHLPPHDEAPASKIGDVTASRRPRPYDRKFFMAIFAGRDASQALSLPLGQRNAAAEFLDTAVVRDGRRNLEQNPTSVRPASQRKPWSWG